MNNLVPQTPEVNTLGTNSKRWGEVHSRKIYADEFAGGIAEEVNQKASLAELARVEGLIAFASAPNYYERDVAFKASGRTKITSPGTLWLNINNKGHKLTEAVTLDINEHSIWDFKASEWQAGKSYSEKDYVFLGYNGFIYECVTAGTSSTLTPAFPTTVGATYNDGTVVWKCCIDYAAANNRAGKDFYIYAIYSPETIEPGLLISANATVPEKYTAETSRKVGGFHCLCEDCGTLTNPDSAHPLSGFVKGDVIPTSVWDLKHRPISAPEGMAYVEGLDMWFSIYLLSWEGTYAAGTLKLTSKYGAEVADGASAEKWHPLKFEQQLGMQKMRLPTWQEFQVLSLGSNQGTNIYGSADPGTTGGHKDTASRRMISNCGMEDCCGCHWQWGSDVGSASTGSSSYGNYYDTNDHDVRGQTYGAVYRPLLGGSWSNAAVCGSRSSSWTNGALSLLAYCGARAASEPLARNAV